MSIFSSNRTTIGSVYLEDIEPDFSCCTLEESALFYLENSYNDLDFMSYLDMNEHTLIKYKNSEKYSEELFNEAGLEFVNKSIEKLKSIINTTWSKLKGLIESFIAKMNKLIDNNKKLIEKNKVAISGKNLTKFKFEFSKIKPDGFKRLDKGISGISSSLNEGISKVKSKTKDIEMPEILSIFTGVPTKASEFGNVIHDKCFEAKKTVQGMTPAHIKDIKDVLTNPKHSIGLLVNAKNSIDSFFKNILSNLTTLAKSKDPKLIRKVSKAISNRRKAMHLAINNLVKLIKEKMSNARELLLKVISFKPNRPLKETENIEELISYVSLFESEEVFNEKWLGLTAKDYMNAFKFDFKHGNVIYPNMLNANNPKKLMDNAKRLEKGIKKCKTKYELNQYASGGIKAAVNKYTNLMEEDPKNAKYYKEYINWLKSDYMKLINQQRKLINEMYEDYSEDVDKLLEEDIIFSDDEIELMEEDFKDVDFIEIIQEGKIKRKIINIRKAITILRSLSLRKNEKALAKNKKLLLNCLKDYDSIKDLNILMEYIDNYIRVEKESKHDRPGIEKYNKEYVKFLDTTFRKAVNDRKKQIRNEG